MAVGIGSGKPCGHSSGMQCDDDMVFLLAGNLDCRRADDLVLRRLGCPIADPAAKAVVTYRPHARRERGEDGAPPCTQQRAEIPQQQGHSGRIQRELPGHGMGIDRADGLFRRVPVDDQRTRGIEDQIKLLLRKHIGRACHAVLIHQIQPVAA